MFQRNATQVSPVQVPEFDIDKLVDYFLGEKYVEFYAALYAHDQLSTMVSKCDFNAFLRYTYLTSGRALTALLDVPSDRVINQSLDAVSDHELTNVFREFCMSYDNVSYQTGRLSMPTRAELKELFGSYSQEEWRQLFDLMSENDRNRFVINKSASSHLRIR